MKIQCDVCEKEEAIVFCSADEAALCQACDHCVHHANKLATKHLRFNLQSPSSKDCPLCDICQERRALLFCQEDRAILCMECDGAIHQANEYTKNHNRFLLTGVKLSADSSTYQASSASSGTISLHVLTSKSSNITLNSSEVDSHCYGIAEMAQGASSNITEYLMETLPGWGFDDFLDASPSPYGYCC